MKNILMIGTGGTIASEMTPSGLTPELNSTQLLSFVPRIGEMCQPGQHQYPSRTLAGCGQGRAGELR